MRELRIGLHGSINFGAKFRSGKTFSVIRTKNMSQSTCCNERIYFLVILNKIKYVRFVTKDLSPLLVFLINHNHSFYFSSG
jgi:hypothetical protein